MCKGDQKLKRVHHNTGHIVASQYLLLFFSRDIEMSRRCACESIYYFSIEMVCQQEDMQRDKALKRTKTRTQIESTTFISNYQLNFKKIHRL